MFSSSKNQLRLPTFLKPTPTLTPAFLKTRLRLQLKTCDSTDSQLQLHNPPPRRPTYPPPLVEGGGEALFPLQFNVGPLGAQAGGEVIGGIKVNQSFLASRVTLCVPHLFVRVGRQQPVVVVEVKGVRWRVQLLATEEGLLEFVVEDEAHAVRVQFLAHKFDELVVGAEVEMLQNGLQLLPRNEVVALCVVPTEDLEAPLNVGCGVHQRTIHGEHNCKHKNLIRIRFFKFLKIKIKILN